MKTEHIRTKFPMNLQLFAVGDPEPAPQEPEKTFTQSELDAIVRERLMRDRKGREDYEDIKAKLAEMEGKQPEYAAEKEAAEKRAQEAEEARTNALKVANERLVKAEFKALAATGEQKIRPDAIEDAFKLADISGVMVDDSGNVAGMAEVISALISSKPYLADQSAGTRQIGGETNGGSHKIDTSVMDARSKMALGYSSTSNK
ncbi:scaffolding protein [Paenibacillus xylanilyticus]|uniref:scaffolding protein n=1 Tax=Paenibacillus xylanilyticus TaxID=248903 RepID=UPI00129E1D3E|nr:scaffolding protein [Paenibacillus xylanilyticus]